MLYKGPSKLTQYIVFCFYIPRKSKLPPNHNTSPPQQNTITHTPIPMHYALAATNASRYHRAPPVDPPTDAPSTSATPGWRDQLASLRAWLADLFAPLQCSKRPTKRVATASTQTEPSSPPPSPATSDPSPAPVPSAASATAPPLPPTTPAIVRDKVHAYVDAWYEANHDGVDLGRIDLPLIGEVDVFPDEREKALYRKVFTLALTNLLEVEVKVAGVPMRLAVVKEAEGKPGGGGG